MNLITKTFQYLDKGGHKRTNHMTVCVLFMGALLILFIPLVIKLLQARMVEHGLRFVVPHEFSLSTVLVLVSSWFLYRAKWCKDRDRLRGFRYTLMVVLMLGALFLALQYSGWQEVFMDHDHQQLKILMVIVAVHGLHFFIALTLIIALLLQTLRIKSGADFYIHFLDPAKNLSFRSAFLYWHYLGLLWTGMYIILLLKGI